MVHYRPRHSLDGAIENMYWPDEAVARWRSVRWFIRWMAIYIWVFEIFWGGAHRAPSIDPFPLILGLCPRFGLHPQFLGFAHDSGFTINSRVLCALDCLSLNKFLYTALVLRIIFLTLEAPLFETSIILYNSITFKPLCTWVSKHNNYICQVKKHQLKTAFVLIADVTISGTPCPRQITIYHLVPKLFRTRPDSWAIPPPS